MPIFSHLYLSCVTDSRSSRRIYLIDFICQSRYHKNLFTNVVWSFGIFLTILAAREQRKFSRYIEVYLEGSIVIVVSIGSLYIISTCLFLFRDGLLSIRAHQFWRLIIIPPLIVDIFVLVFGYVMSCVSFSICLSSTPILRIFVYLTSFEWQHVDSLGCCCGFRI